MEVLNAIGFSPVSLAVVFLGALIIFKGPRNWILPTFLTVSVFVSLMPHFVILGQNFMTHRILLACAWIRILAHGEHRRLALSKLDKAVIAFCVWIVIGDTLLFMTVNAMVYQIANSIYDALGIYFLCRILVNDARQLNRLIVCLAGICVVLAGFMTIEHVTHHNWLTVLGALHDVVQVRQGRFRCQASFSVPITAGTFGAALLPLFVACWWQGGRMKKVAVAGCIAATIITVAAASGGPVMTFAAAVGGLFLWQARHRMRQIRWIVGFALLGLHLVMKAPVWALIERIHVIPGSSSYHRYELVDTFIRHFGDWWLLGAKSTEQWGWLMDDVANQFCVVAKHGGILSLILFVRVLVIAFREVGVRLQEAPHDRPKQFMIWAFGVMLAAHCISFLGISYFDQIKVFWYISLAAIASLHLLTETQKDALVERILPTSVDAPGLRPDIPNPNAGSSALPA